MFEKMFGLIVSGRLVKTDFQQIGTTQFVTVVQEADNINHVVVFLTGVQPFPEGFGGSVYFSWPDPTSPPSWQLLGFITNNKPSVIFRITKLKPTVTSGNPIPMFGSAQISHNAQIGISIEPLSQIASQSPNVVTEPSNTSMFMEFAQRVIQNLFDYAASFAVTQAQMTVNPNETYVPMSALRSWYNNFLRKLELNPQFWKN